MATPTAQKPKFKMLVDYESTAEDAVNGWKTAEAEREFAVPDSESSIKIVTLATDGVTEEKTDRKFRRRVVGSKKDVLDLLESEELLTIAALNYGIDLFSRSAIKQPLINEIEGPGKQIKKLADQIFDSRKKIGHPVTPEQALQLARIASGIMDLPKADGEEEEEAAA